MKMRSSVLVPTLTVTAGAVIGAYGGDYLNSHTASFIPVANSGHLVIGAIGLLALMFLPAKNDLIDNLLIGVTAGGLAAFAMQYLPAVPTSTSSSASK